VTILDNVSATLNPGAPTQGRAEPEEVTSAEIGLKKDFGSRVRLNTSIYFATYEGIQLQVIQQSTGGNFLTNGPDAESKGIDIQADARISDNFRLSVGATLLDAKFTEKKAADPVAGTGPLPIEGNRLPGAAEFAASLVGDYTFNLASGAVIDWSTTYVYNSGKWYEHWNVVGSGGTTDKSYDLLHMALTFKSANDHWSAGLWGNNLLDEEYYRTGISWAGGARWVSMDAGTPCAYGVDFTYKFDDSTVTELRPARSNKISSESPPIDMTRTGPQSRRVAGRCFSLLPAARTAVLLRTR
jgi:iron complex outermembrane receptor protein